MKNLYLITLIGLLIFGSKTLLSQTGLGSCDNAIPLILDMNCSDSNSIPAGGNFGDPTGFDNTDTHPCSDSYAGGDDWFYSYTPSTNETITLDLFGTNTWTGLMVSDDCTGLDPSGNCVASSTSSSSDESLSFNACSGVTYYIHISTWPSPQSIGAFCLNASTAPTAYADAASGGACSFEAGGSASAAGICGGETIVAGVDIPDDADVTDPGIDYGCLLSTPNPAWFYFEISSPGDLAITIDSDTNVDIDYALWGPFSSLAAATSQCDYGAPVDCDYTTADGGTATTNCAQAGDVFILLVTNFSNTANNISIDESAGTATTDCSVVMPIDLIRFEAYSKGEVNMIEWRTITQVNNEFQIIEKSENGIDHWQELVRINGERNSTEILNYHAIDNDPLKTTYYRLKSIDFDGEEEIFNTVVVQRDENKSEIMGITPNPFNQNTTLNINSNSDQQGSIVIHNMAGLVIYRDEFSLVSGVNSLSIDLQAYSSGIYIVEVLIAGENEVIKLFKN